jgi:hypothetical protein
METEVISSSEDCEKTTRNDTAQMPTSIKIPMTNSEDKRRRRRRNTSALVWNNVDHSCHSWFGSNRLHFGLPGTADLEQPYSVVRGFVNGLFETV